jgi:hypothetical protein
LRNRCFARCALAAMASINSIVVTPELQQVLRDLTKAVMRDQPVAVLEYSHLWFVNQFTDRRMGARRAARCVAAGAPPLVAPASLQLFFFPIPSQLHTSSIRRSLRRTPRLAPTCRIRWRSSSNGARPRRLSLSFARRAPAPRVLSENMLAGRAPCRPRWHATAVSHRHAARLASAGSAALLAPDID